MIPQRTLTGICEITTGLLSITQKPPIFTGENSALQVQISFKVQDVNYSIPSGVTAEMYLKFPNTDKMTVSVPMTISGNTATGILSGAQTGIDGYPLLVVQLMDTSTDSVIVACATPVKVTSVRGKMVVDSRVPSPSEIVYIGRAPYVNPSNNHWMQWDNTLSQYVDSGVCAVGTGVGSVDNILPDNNGNVYLTPITNSEIDAIMAS